MTIDETGNPVNTESMQVVIPMENETMIREWGTKLINALVEASDLAKRVQALQTELEKITNALTVANDTAAKAIAERDEAFKARDRANELREQAEHAYQNVNEQRITVSRELVDAVNAREVLSVELSNARLALADAKADAELWESEVKKIQQDVFNATNSAASMVDAVKAERDAVISALRLEVQALKDERFDLHNKLDTSELDVSMLRKIIQEAKLYGSNFMGVLEGTLAAE